MRSPTASDDEPAQPLGEAIRAPVETDEDDAWVPLPGSPGIEVNMSTGKWRTNISSPPPDIVIGIPP